MADPAAQAAPAPRHLWAVGIASLVWNTVIAMDYAMTQARFAAYTSRFPEAHLAYFFSFPVWAQAAWAISQWAAVAGSVLLLMRRGAAVSAFWIALMAMILPSLYDFTLADVSASETAGFFATAFSAVTAIVAVLLLYYAITQRANGALR